VIYDTDVLIFALRNFDRALQTIDDDLSVPSVSSISCMELFYGAHDKTEMAKMQNFIGRFHVHLINESISLRAQIYMERFALAVRMDPMDALIAATAVEHNLPLCTGNIKHFRHIEGLQLEHFRA